MALPADPVSGGYSLTNPGFDNFWTCPNCHADLKGAALRDTTVECLCGARLILTVEQHPVCRATCIDPEKA